MLKFLKILFFSSALIILAAVFVLVFHFQETSAQAGEYPLSGWAWSENYGWISLNIANTQPSCTVDTCSNYYSVQVDSNNNLSGYGWSSNLGWIGFGATVGRTASLDGNSGKIEGYAQVVSLGEDGWIHFRRGGSVGGQAGYQCYDCEKKCLAWTQNCQTTPQGEEVCVDSDPCLDFSETEFENCLTCFSNTCFCEGLPSGNYEPGSNCDLDCQHPSGVAGDDPVYRGSEFVCTGSGRGNSEPDPACTGATCCSNCCTGCQKVAAIDGSFRIECDSCPSCELYGTNVDWKSGEIVGWAWDGTASGLTGAGWLHLNPLSGGALVVLPWLETQFGSIYSGKEIRQKAGSGGANASYCIFADDIQNVSSSNCQQGVIKDVELGYLEEGAGRVYRNALGRIDLAGLTTVYQTANGRNYNKYGQEIIAGDLADEFVGTVRPGDKVYYHTAGDLTINNLDEFGIGPLGGYGNGLIVVEGDLYLNRDFDYESGAFPAELNQLPSVAWIVKGDIVVAPDVKDIVGAFILLGNGNSCQETAGSDPEYPEYQTNGCGVFFSGFSNYPLTAKGVVIAHAFDFRRTYTSPSQGSERIIYDGRLAANPPPGLGGFVEGLPVIRSF